MQWHKLPALSRARHLESRRASLATLEAEATLGTSEPIAEWIEIYHAEIELLEREEERIAGRIPSPVRSVVAKALAAATIAAAVLTPLDAIQVRGGVLSQGSGLSCAPLSFGVLGLVLGLISPWLDPRSATPTRLTLAFDGAIFVVGYLLTLVGRDDVIFGVLAALIVITWIRAAAVGVRAAELIPFALLLGIGGPLLEASSVALGLFHYARPTTLGIPLWLPLLWISGAPIARDLFAGHVAGSS